ncbi:MAG: lamin tail domain-containing protein, partial [Verrucomicrobiales bacterium]
MKSPFLPLLFFLFLFSTSASAQVVINEIMFHPAHAEDVAEPKGDEYIELLNTGPDPVSLLGWQFDRGVSFTFGNVLLQPGAFIVVAADVPAFQAAHPGVSNVVGGWAGQLSNSGESIRLIDGESGTVDSVSYADQGDWAQRVRESSNGEDGWTWNSQADGSGSSLELRNPALSNNSGQNWS